jgi:hypothetical protein
MKNTKKMTSLVGSQLSSRLSNHILAAVLFSTVTLAVAVPSQAQRTTFTMPRFTPPAQTYHPPAQTSRPASQSTYHPPAQTSRPAQTQPRPAQPQSTPRTTGSTPQPRPESAQPHPTPAPSRKEVQKQEKAQARVQKDQQKQNEKQQKEQARQQKEQQKQQQKRAKEQQKEQARQQKELQKKQKSHERVAKSAKAPRARTASPSVGKAPTNKAPTNKAPASKAPANSAGTKNSTEVPASESQTRIQRLNSSRSSMSGINRKPLPAGEVTVHSNGRMTLKAEGGLQYGLRANGTIASYSDREKTVSFDRGGKVSSIHTASMDIHDGAHGQRTIISRRADGSKVVSTGGHSGYVERNVVMNNRNYLQRTTVINQRVYTRTFLANGFGGVAFVPPVFFAPGFYGWAYYPWAAPIGYTWGWVGAPWYSGFYFVASPRYPSAAFWLTDYLIGETLATAYQLHHEAAGFDDASDDMSADDSSADSTDAGATADGDTDRSSDQETVRADATTPITSELKAEVAEEIRQQLATDNAEASNPSQASFDMLPAALSTPNHVFVVSSDLDVTTTDQQLCALQAGDMLQLMTPAASDSGLVELRVASSKRMDCPAGVLVSVSLTDLQEMQNNFQAQIEAGLGTLRDSQGRGGLPSAPPDAVAAPPRPAVTGLAPVSAADSSALLDQQREQADQAEKQAASGSF